MILDEDDESAFQKVYEDLSGTILRSLDNVSDPESAQEFVTQVSKQIESAKTTLPDFYTREFFGELQPLVAARTRAEVEQCQQTLSDAQAEAAAISAELNERLRPARASGDRREQHAIWGEGEVKQAEIQAKIDAVSKRLDVPRAQLLAWTSLTSSIESSANSVNRSDAAHIKATQQTFRSASQTVAGPLEQEIALQMKRATATMKTQRDLIAKQKEELEEQAKQIAALTEQHLMQVPVAPQTQQRETVSVTLPEDALELGCTFTLGGRKWHCRRREDIPRGMFVRIMNAEDAEAGQKLVQIEPFFRDILVDEERDAFAALLSQEVLSPMTLRRYEELMQHLTEQVLNRPKEGERPIVSS